MDCSGTHKCEDVAEIALYLENISVFLHRFPQSNTTLSIWIWIKQTQGFPYFLDPEAAPRLSHIFPVLVLKLPIAPETLNSFSWTKVLVLNVYHAVLISVKLQRE